MELEAKDIEVLAAKCYRSPVEFARIFFPEWFPQPMPWFHRGVLALLKGRAEFLLDFGHEVWRDGEGDWTPADLERIFENFVDEHTKEPLFALREVDGKFSIEILAKRNVVIVLPRGFSKTTLLNMNTCHEVAYHDAKYVLYLSESAPHAQEQLETVKSEFETNEMLRLVFGEQQPPRQDSRKWAVDFIETMSGIMVGTVGTGGQVRGKTKHAKRPDLLVFDDLQNETSVESETELRKDNRWFWRAAMKAGARNSRKIVLGTLLHTEAVLNKAIANRQFSAIRLGALDAKGKAIWPWHMNEEQLEEDRLGAIEAGELSGWYMEMMSEFRSDEARIFPESKIIYIAKGLERFIGMSLAMDPAISKAKRACETAMAVCGIEAAGFKHVLACEGKKGMDPFEMLENFFELHFRYMAHLPIDQRKYGIEAVQFQAALLPIARTMMVEKSKVFGQKAYFEIEGIHHGSTQKESRIKGILKPLMMSNTLTFAEHLKTSPLHQQMLDFKVPPSGLIDRPDAVAMAIALLDPYVTLGLEEPGTQLDLANDNAPPLAQVLGNFRRAP